MYPMYPTVPGSTEYQFLAYLPFIIIPLIVWSLAWKGWALWTAARAGSKVWFIVLLLVNSLGILDIIYIFLVAKKSLPTDSTPSTTVSH